MYGFGIDRPVVPFPQVNVLCCEYSNQIRPILSRVRSHPDTVAGALYYRGILTGFRSRGAAQTYFFPGTTLAVKYQRGQPVFSCVPDKCRMDAKSEYWVLLDIRKGRRSVEFLDVALRSLDDARVLYLAVFTGISHKEEPMFPSIDDLDILHEIFRLVAQHGPRLSVVPVFDVLYKGGEGSIRMPNVVYVPDTGRDTSAALMDFVESCWGVTVDLPVAKTFHDAERESACPPHARTGDFAAKQQARILFPEDGTLQDKDRCQNGLYRVQFDTVAVGGTFDRFHAGHRLLLAATAMVAKKAVFVGISSKKLLQNKNLKETLQDYSERERAAISFMKCVNPSLQVTPGPLTDPLVPPLCATEEGFDAIVVSEETIGGAHEINRVRKGQGFNPLVIVVVGLLQHGASNKLSSSDLRISDATVEK